MKSRLQFLLSMFSLFLIIFTGCEKTNMEQLISRWQLTEVWISYLNDGEWDSISYLIEDTVIYDFRENGNLIVTGAMPDSLLIFDDFQEGKYFYKYRFYTSEGVTYKESALKIQQRLGGKQKQYECVLDIWDNYDKMRITDEKIINNIEYRISKIFITLKDGRVLSQKMMVGR